MGGNLLIQMSVTIEGRYKKVIEAPHQISVENSSTIEGTKKLMQHPPLKRSWNIHYYWNDIEKLKKFHQKGTQTLCNFPVLLEGH